MAKLISTSPKYHDPYMAEGDAHTLQRAGEITADPKRHKAALGHISNQVDIMQKVMKSAPKMGKTPMPGAKAPNGLGFAKGRK